MDIIEQEEQNNWREIKQQMLVRQQEIASSVAAASKELKEFQHYLVNYKGEIDPHEMFTNVRLQEQQILAGSVKFQQLEKLQKQLSNPYFTRVDFLFSGEEHAEVLYIGRFSFSNEHNQLLIYDWRAPIASLFYDFDFGPAYYQSPNSKVNGKITGKRQIKFKHGTIDYVLDTHTTVFDEVLQKELSNQQSGRMSTIIGTIQKEQNQIIRANNRRDLIVHGVAGSGKTSIALHRIAFLLYQNRERLSSDQITILSPNQVFGTYISEVLPELGEEPVNEWSIDLLVESISGQAATISRLAETELAIANQLPERIRYLAASKCVLDLENFLQELDQSIFQAETLVIGSYNFSTDYLKRRFLAYNRQPIMERLAMIASDVLEEMKKKPFRPKRLPTKGQIKKELLRQLTYRSSKAIYKAYLETQGFQTISSYCYSDLFPLLRIQAFFEKDLAFKNNKYVVVDEMQDYTLMQMEVIKRLFPCQRLLVGDYTQQLTDNNVRSLSHLQKVFPEAEMVQLTKSYRSTYEIMTFAKGLIDDQLIEPVVRHGEAPEIIAVKQEEILSEIIAKLDLFTSKFETIALITKDSQQAIKWQKQLDQYKEVSLLKDTSQMLAKTGVYLCGVSTAKGLEFDAVIVLDSQKENFSGRTGQQQLFVAATRAIHHLVFIERSFS
ncbi:HelD family protein [Enterococcus sp. AZ109]|uniref:HelD family protein n=1 Tax=Enterococcus sp. AZ109 TaxID=2774634 RepID=UPI003F28D9DD